MAEAMPSSALAFRQEEEKGISVYLSLLLPFDSGILALLKAFTGANQLWSFSFTIPSAGDVYPCTSPSPGLGLLIPDSVSSSFPKMAFHEKISAALYNTLFPIPCT
ncbi:hypothetical protein STEG23_014231, partial [Scotinomys teguina]